MRELIYYGFGGIAVLYFIYLVIVVIRVRKERAKHDENQKGN